jgi:hypothetical protein
MDPSDEGERSGEKRYDKFGFGNIDVVQQLVRIYQLFG